jgi:ferredoxin-type protein NapF
MQLITDEFHLLSDRFSTRNSPCRPPWAIAELPFIQTCDRCGECIDACPEHILIYGRGDYPEVDFSKGGCTFCGKCSLACKPGGLRYPDKQPWHLKAFIAETCLTNSGTECNDCCESCPAKAISFRQQVGNTSVPILEELLCTGCGTCVSACPVSAIHVY